MTVLVDPPMWPRHGRLWAHLVSDASLDELHGFARLAGIPERGFDLDHYDVPDERYAALVALGAVPVDGHELIRRLRASGLRVPARARARHAGDGEIFGGGSAASRLLSPGVSHAPARPVDQAP